MVDDKFDVARHFDDRSGHYSARADWVEEPSSLQPIVARCAALHDPVVLDLGTGSGAVRAELAASPQVRTRLSVGLDISRGMLDGQAGPTLVADAAGVPLRSGSVDLVVCRQVLHYPRSPLAALAEVARVLAPGGLLLVAQIVPFDDPEDVRWWKRAVAMRQPLRRHRWTVPGLRDVLEKVGYVVAAPQYVTGRSSLQSWLSRYPTPALAQQALETHYREAPTRVRALRDFCVLDRDIEYSIRWTFLEARPVGTVARPEATAPRVLR